MVVAGCIICSACVTKVHLEHQLITIIRAAAGGSAKRARWVDSPSSGFFSSLSTTGDDADGELESALSAARRKLADVKGRQSSLGTVPALEAAFEIADDDEEQAEDEDEDLPFVSGSSAMLYAAT